MSVKAMPTSTITGSEEEQEQQQARRPQEQEPVDEAAVRCVAAHRHGAECPGGAGRPGSSGSAQLLDDLHAALEFVGHLVLEEVDGLRPATGAPSRRPAAP